jgi:hypothetical protein
MMGRREGNLFDGGAQAPPHPSPLPRGERGKLGWWGFLAAVKMSALNGDPMFTKTPK